MSTHHAENSLSAGDEAGQTLLCYSWEATQFSFRNEAIITLDQCHDLVKRAWHGLELPGHAPKVVDGRGSEAARNWHRVIHLPRWARNNIVVLHELAHTLTNHIDPTDSYEHGGIFVHVMITLLTRFSGYKYKDLADSARAFGLTVTRVQLATRLKGFDNHEV